MKLSNALLTLASLALANVSTALPKASPAPSTSSSAASTSFASTSGLQFTIDGETGYFAGTNSYWIGFLTDNSDVDLVMSHLKSSGLKILRVWGFNDVTSQPSSGTVWYQLHQDGKSTINTGADGLQRLDYVVSSAEQHDIKLIINFVNYWTDCGGMSAYVSAYGGSDETDFYTSDTMQSAYQTYIKTVVERYSNSSAVFAWELANEPRCPSCDTSVLYNWIEKTSKFIKGLDADRMVCIGDEGFGLNIDSDGSYPYQFSEGLNFTMNLGIDTIDFGTLHLYPDSCTYHPLPLTLLAINIQTNKIKGAPPTTGATAGSPPTAQPAKPPASHVFWRNTESPQTTAAWRARGRRQPSTRRASAQICSGSMVMI
ncbi:hypothetical protein ACMYSQ_003536 [Aspergillus niger]